MLLSTLLRDVRPIAVVGETAREIARITHDSRDAGPHDLFVAIRGARLDARELVPDLDVAAVVADGPVQARPGVTVIQVADARAALAPLAAANHDHPGARIPVVGITGTNGKTTVAWFLEAIARGTGGTAAVIGTTGHRVAGQPRRGGRTTPEAPVIQALLDQAAGDGCLLAAIEVSSIGLALHRADAIPYRVAVFTSFSRDHLDFHGTMAAYLAAKSRLFSELLAPDGVAVLCAEDSASAQVRPADRRVWTYGLGPDADIRATRVQATLDGTEAWLQTPAGTGTLRLRLLGRHNLLNALGALGAALALGVDLQQALDGLGALEQVPGRLQRVPGSGGPSVLVDYAHTPDALETVLDVLRPLTTGRLLTVFGCGGDRDQGKRPMMGRIASERSDLVLVTSDNPRSEDPGRIIEDVLVGVSGPHEAIEDRVAAIDRAVSMAGPDDVVLIAGKGHETTQTIGDRVIELDDRVVAGRALRRRRGEA